MYRAQGCPHCSQTGYAGRIPLQEILVLTEPLRRAILREEQEGTLERLARQEGFQPLWEAGREKVLAGETSGEELLRVLG